VDFDSLTLHAHTNQPCYHQTTVTCILACVRNLVSCCHCLCAVTCLKCFCLWHRWGKKTTNHALQIRLEKVAIVNALQHKAAQCHASCSGLFWLNLYLKCVQTAIFQLLVTILTLLLYSATLISFRYKYFSNWWAFSSIFCYIFTVHAQWNCYFAASNKNSNIAIRFSDPDLIRRHFSYFFTVQMENLLYCCISTSCLFDLMTLNIGTHIALHCGIIFTNFELGQTICSWLIMILLLMCYVTLWPFHSFLWMFVVRCWVSHHQSLYQIWGDWTKLHQIWGEQAPSLLHLHFSGLAFLSFVATLYCSAPTFLCHFVIGAL